MSTFTEIDKQLVQNVLKKVRLFNDSMFREENRTTWTSDLKASKFVVEGQQAARSKGGFCVVRQDDLTAPSRLRNSRFNALFDRN